MANLALLHPIGAAVSATYAAAAWAWRHFKAAARAGVYPGSPQHQAALRSVEDRTAPAFTAWPDLPTAVPAAHDRAAIDHAVTGIPAIQGETGRTQKGCPSSRGTPSDQRLR